MADKDTITFVEHSLVQRYNERGFLLEDEVIDCCVDHNLDLADIDTVCDRLLKRKVIFRDEQLNNTNEETDSDEIYDRSKLDYDVILDEIKNEYPNCEDLVNQIKLILPPQHKEWKMLIGEAQSGNLFAKNRIIGMYLRTLMKSAYDFSKNYYCDFEDCFQNAVIGLIIAIDKFDISSPDTFGSYFPLWSRQVMNRDCFVKGTIFRFPIHYKELLLSVINGLNETEIGFDIIANVDQSIIDNQYDFEDYDLIYDKLNRIFSMLFKSDYLKLANNRFNYNHILPYLPFFDVLSNDNDIIETVISNETSSAIRENLELILTEKEYKVIVMRYGFDDYAPKTLEEIGIALGVTRERIRQIEIRALNKLKKFMEGIKV